MLPFTLCFLICSPILSAEPEFTRLEISEKDFGPASDDWYGVYDFAGKKIGYARFFATPPEEKKPYFEYRHHFKMNLVALGEKINVYLGDEARGFGGHEWNEVVLDGTWTPVDPTWNETEVNATHLRYGHGSQSIGVLAATAGKLRFEVKDVQRKKQTR